MSTYKALRNLAKEHGKPWSELIHEWAEAGYTWADVASFIGIPVRNLKQFCYYRKLKFPWQGMKAPVERDRQRRRWYDRNMPGNANAKRHTVRGVTGTLPELADWFGVKKNTVYTRMRAYNMTLEEALTTPVATPTEAGHLGQEALERNGTRSNYWKEEGRLKYEKKATRHAGL